MPVHLFGRPAPLAGARASSACRSSRTRRRRSARPRSRRRRSSRPSASSRRRTSSASATAASSRRNDEELAERVRMLRFHGSRDKKTSSYVGYNSRLDEMQAAVLRLFLRELDGWNARAPRGRGPLRGARPRRARRAPAGRAGPRLPPLRLPLAASATRSAPRSRRRRSRPRTTTCRRSTCSRRCATSATSEGSLPETEQRRRENFSLPLWAGIAADAQERVVDAVRAAVAVAPR